jgi:hypothetical protein
VIYFGTVLLAVSHSGVTTAMERSNTAGQGHAGANRHRFRTPILSDVVVCRRADEDCSDPGFDDPNCEGSVKARQQAEDLKLLKAFAMELKGIVG